MAQRYVGWILQKVQQSHKPPCSSCNGDADPKVVSVAVVVELVVTYNVYHFFANAWVPYMLTVMAIEVCAGCLLAGGMAGGG